MLLRFFYPRYLVDRANECEALKVHFFFLLEVCPEITRGREKLEDESEASFFNLELGKLFFSTWKQVERF